MVELVVEQQSVLDAVAACLLLNGHVVEFISEGLAHVVAFLEVDLDLLFNRQLNGGLVVLHLGEVVLVDL